MFRRAPRRAPAERFRSTFPRAPAERFRSMVLAGHISSHPPTIQVPSYPPPLFRAIVVCARASSEWPAHPSGAHSA
eukprot:1906701-Pyramimonas_sp.AAC.1